MEQGGTYANFVCSADQNQKPEPQEEVGVGIDILPALKSGEDVNRKRSAQGVAGGVKERSSRTLSRSLAPPLDGAQRLEGRAFKLKPSCLRHLPTSLRSVDKLPALDPTSGAPLGPQDQSPDFQPLRHSKSNGKNQRL
jgi:hypothetical protein